jgi:hypothetical protein
MNALSKILISAALLLQAAPAAAQDDIWNYTINNETNGVWTVQPDRPRPRDVDAPDYLGGKAVRVRGREGANPWVVQAQSLIGGDIAQGDVIMVMIYARAEAPAAGGSMLPIMVQLAGEPYTTAMAWNERITGEWQQYCANAVASADMPGGRANVSVHLGTAEHVVDLGPVFVFNFGPDYDASTLPSCA